MTRYHVTLDNNYAYTTSSSDDAAEKAVEWLKVGQVSITNDTSKLIYWGLKIKKHQILSDINQWL